MQSEIAIHVYYALYEITHLQYRFVIYLFYYAFTLIWPFYIRITMHKKNCYIHIFFICILYAHFHILLAINISIKAPEIPSKGPFLDTLFWRLLLWPVRP
jgi:hypothetical protein